MITDEEINLAKKCTIAEVFKLSLVDTELRKTMYSRGLELAHETLMQGFIIQNTFINKLGLTKDLS